MPRTEVVVLKTDETLLAKVEAPKVPVVVNEDLDRKALRFEKALEECNARLDDVRRAQELAVQQALNQPVASWWKRVFGGER